MKNILFFCLLLAGHSCFAQRFQIGAKAGVNFSNFTGDNIKSDGLVGFHVGGLLNFMVGNNFSIQPEVLFSTQGAKFDNGGMERDLKISYINIPVMLKLKMNSGFYVELGPQVGFKLDEDAEIPNLPVENFAKNLDLSLGAGIGYHTRSGFGIGGRYIAGISKVGDFDASAQIDPDFKNSVIQISVFYTLFNNR